MAHKSILGILMIISFFMFGCSNISGTITIDDVPLKGVEVELSKVSGDTIGFATTDSEGLYSFFDNIEPGSYAITPKLTGHAFRPGSTSVEAEPLKDVNGIDFDTFALIFKAQLPPAIPAPYDAFGGSVSIFGEYALVGAPGRESQTGAAYVYKRDGINWPFTINLTASDASVEDKFGYSASIAGDFAFIGAPGREGHSGAVYIFYRNEGGDDTWGEQHKLTGIGAGSGDELGFSVSSFRHNVIAGAPYDDDMGTDAGAVYIFFYDGNNWSEQAKLIDSDGAMGDQFGHSVSISRDYIIVGALGDEGGTGSACIFKFNGSAWDQQAKLTASDGAVGDGFGCSVSISGDSAIIGSNGDDDDGPDSGSAYIFNRNESVWTEEGKLRADDAMADARFGSSVSIWGRYTAVGAPYHENGTGSAYIYYQNEGDNFWGLKEKFTLTDGEEGDHFGVVCITGGSLYAIIGVPGANDSGADSGSAHVYYRDWMTNNFDMTFHCIYDGTFIMGCPVGEPGSIGNELQHQVTLTQNFYMQTTEVTQGQWEAIITAAETAGFLSPGDLNKTPSWFSSCGTDCPVEVVSWDDIQIFIGALNQLGEGTYSLPTEAQWEYAARAGSTTAFANGEITVPFGGNDPVLDQIGWYTWNSGSTTHGVAQFPPNAWGLHDMHGNVFEWVQDWYGDYPSDPVTDPTGPATGSEHPIRSGGWAYEARFCRSASRLGSSPDGSSRNIGFRLVLLPGQ